MLLWLPDSTLKHITAPMWISTSSSVGGIRMAISGEADSFFSDAEDASQAVVDGLKERGVLVRTYENGNQQDRMDIISNATEEMGLRFRTVEITPEVRKENDDIRFRVTDNNLTGFKIKTNDIGIDINRMEDNAVMPETVPYDIKE